MFFFCVFFFYTNLSLVQITHNINLYKIIIIIKIIKNYINKTVHYEESTITKSILVQ